MLIAKAPEELSDEQLAAFVDLVVSEGEVTPNGLAGRARRALGLAMLYDEGVLVGTAAVKNPDVGYRAGVFAKSHSTAIATNYPIELGYVVVAATHRGKKLGWKLVDAALQFANGLAVFATTRSNNGAMQRILTARGFATNGSSYPSAEHPNQKIHLFLREKVSDLNGQRDGA
ncbi:MAG: GNAT family N-acetyltransferase [Mesorhizobium sp.]|uniref:GNAT family N-acetyltransferase n=1 Tax=Mesorhizobium sp. TaxID=1871066 RepID=UPI000FE591E9|nr:GNAT family N-acetyltransferase [Mesorhizobium sp.]RWA75650.1 MAG: GNAT family N-acetyltransferase [Mesorhizobium sp.]